MSKYTFDQKMDYQRQLAELLAYWETKLAGGGDGGAARLGLALKLLDLGVEPEDARDGLLINGRVVVAVKKAKYRLAHNYEWKSYKELPFVVAVAKGEGYQKEFRT